MNQYLTSLGKQYENNLYTFEQGDLFLLYTDGLIEKRIADTRHKDYGHYMENEILPTLYQYKSEEAIDILYSNLNKQCITKNFKDDICIICMNIE